MRAALGASEASFFGSRGCATHRKCSPTLARETSAFFRPIWTLSTSRSRKPEQVVASVMTKLKKRGKGIVLLHDFQHPTSLALPALLAQLKADGYKIVQVKSKDPVSTRNH